MDMILALNTKGEKHTAYNHQLMKKYPEYPTDQTLDWLNAIRQNPSKTDRWESYMEADKSEAEQFNVAIETQYEEKKMSKAKSPLIEQ